MVPCKGNANRDENSNIEEGEVVTSYKLPGKGHSEMWNRFGKIIPK